MILAPVIVVAASVLQVWLLPYNLLLLGITTMVWLRPTRQKQGKVGPRFVILVPAHNEESEIRQTLVNLQALDYPEGLREIVLIADNCQDQTAAIGRELGVTVLERQDAEKKSKGFALEFALAHLQQRVDTPEAVVIIDADSRVDVQLLKVFAARFDAGQDWLQAYYSVSNADRSVRTRLMTLAFSLFNGAWLLGQDRLGLGSALRGNGICMSWKGLSRCPWRAFGLAEDLEFSWRLRLSGERVHFVEEATVYGEMLERGGQAAAAQRLRWEHGRRQLVAQFARALQDASLPRGKRFFLWADLSMPPLSRYLGAQIIVVILALCAFEQTRSSLTEALGLSLALFAGGQLLVLGLYGLSPFFRLGLPPRFALAGLYAPLYWLWKLTLVPLRAPRVWVRTMRQSERDQVGKKG